MAGKRKNIEKLEVLLKFLNDISSHTVRKWNLNIAFLLAIIYHVNHNKQYEQRDDDLLIRDEEVLY